MKTTVVVVRIAAALAILIAVLAQLASSVSSPVFAIPNFFGYFTIQSNLFVMVTLVLGAVWLARGRPDPEWLLVARGATATYIATTGLVYNTLLLNVPPSDFTVAWSNDIVHRWIPLIAVLDWIFVGDRRPIAWKRLGVFLIYPLVWLIVVLLRGQSFVPYPFLNTATLGWPVVLLYCVGIAVFIGGMSALVIWLSRYRILRVGAA